jgi:hypothetical protein
LGLSVNVCEIEEDGGVLTGWRGYGRREGEFLDEIDPSEEDSW